MSYLRLIYMADFAGNLALCRFHSKHLALRKYLIFGFPKA